MYGTTTKSVKSVLFMYRTKKREIWFVHLRYKQHKNVRSGLLKYRTNKNVKFGLFMYGTNKNLQHLNYLLLKCTNSNWLHWRKR